MRESLRRIILFIVIVTVGSIAILFDVPLIIMIPLIIAVGFIITLLTGALTVSEITAVFKRKKAPEGKKVPDVKKVPDKKKVSFFQRLKKTKPVESTAAQPGGKTPPLPVKKEPVKSDGPQAKKVSRFHSFFSSIRSLGTVMRGRRERNKRVEEIDKQLDSTIPQNIPTSARTGTGTEEKTGVKGGGAVSASVDTPKDLDPLLSASGDEFDADLLAGLDDQDTAITTPDRSGVVIPDSKAIADTLVSDSSVSLPSLDIDTAALDTPEGNDKAESDALGGLDGLSEPADSLDKGLDGLDNLNLDDVVPDEEMEEATMETAGSSAMPDKKPKSSQSPPKSNQIKTDEFTFEAPKDLEKELDQESTQSDMAAFARGTGSDDDLLNSISSDIKHVKKEDDLSLLRDLKDYRAKATEIESELSEIYGSLKSIKNPEK